MTTPTAPVTTDASTDPAFKPAATTTVASPATAPASIPTTAAPPSFSPGEQVDLSAEDLGTLMDIKQSKVARAQDMLAVAQREVETVQKLINLAGQGKRVIAHPSS